MYGVSPVLRLAKMTRTTPMNNDPMTARGNNPAPVTMPALIAQNRKAMSSGSLMALRNRTMERAPTIPSDRMTLDVTARMMSVVMRVSAISDMPKVSEYMTPLNVLR